MPRSLLHVLPIFPKTLCMLDFLELFGIRRAAAGVSPSCEGDGSSTEGNGRDASRDHPTQEPCEGRVDELKRSLEEWERTLQERENTIETYKRMLEEQTREGDEISRELERTKREGDEISRELERTKREAEEVFRELERTRREVEEYSRELERSRRENEHLKEELRRLEFGSTSEKRCPAPGDASSNGTNKADDESEKSSTSDTPGVPGFVSDLAKQLSEHNKKKREKASKERAKERKAKRAARTASLRVREEVIRPTSDDMCPHCGETLGDPFTSETTEKVTACRPAYELVRQIRHIVKCTRCRAILRADSSSDPFPGCQFDSSVAAEVMVSKVVEGVPCDRQAKRFERHGIHVSEDSVNDLFLKGGSLLRSVSTAVLEEARDGDVLHTDDSPLRYRESPTSKYKSGSIWILRNLRGDVGVRFDKGQRTSQGCRAILEGVKTGTIVMTDAFPAIDKVSEKFGLKNANCNVHARRNVVKAEISDPALSGEGLEFFRALYALEAEADLQELDPDARKELRQTRSVPVLESLREWLEAVLMLREPDEKMAKAANYMLTRWEKFMLYTTDGNIPIDNNELERSMKLFARSRKNCYHASSIEGAQALAVVLSLVLTCRNYDINPELYLTDVLKRVAVMHHSHHWKLTPSKWKELYYRDGVLTTIEPELSPATKMAA